RTQRQKPQLLVRKFRDQHTCLGATDIEPDEISVPLRQASTPQTNLQTLICARSRTNWKCPDSKPEGGNANRWTARNRFPPATRKNSAPRCCSALQNRSD